MNGALKLARQYGVAVVVADLGDWGAADLYSEYDPEGPEIRINARTLAQLAPDAAERFIAHAVGHELYHHGEALGEIPRITARAAREREADRFAQALATLE